MAENKITLTKNDESVLFTFADSDHYLTGNGTIEVPLNSLSLVIDSSDMVTFRKAASNDIFVSAPISDFGMTKAELEEWYAENMVGGGTNEEAVQELIDESIANTIVDASYDSKGHTLTFYQKDGTKIDIDASDFIKDGMVSNVEVVGTNLVITFNTDAGKNPISIPLTSFFDGSQYYDKTAIDTMLATKADASAVTVDEYTIYATRNNNVYNTTTSVPITWLKFTPFATGASTTGNFQFSGITGYLWLQNIDFANGTYTVAPSSQVQPSAVSGLLITFDSGNMIVEVDGSNPITNASITNTVIEYVKEVIPQKVASDAIYDNVYPLIRKVNNSLTSVTVNSASTTQYQISLRPRNNANDILPNQIVSLDGYLSYSGTTLKAEAYVNAGTDTLTTVAPTINGTSRTDYYFTDNVGQTAEANHIEIQILASDTVNLAFYGYDNTGRLTSRSLVVSGGTVTSGYGWPAEATYSFSDGVLTVDYAYTGTSANNPLTINRIMATNQYGSTASVSDIVGYVKALLKDKVEVTEYIENTLKPNIDDIEDSLSGKADVSAVTAAVNAVKAYYVSIPTLVMQGITDADWDGLLAAYNAHRPILVDAGVGYLCTVESISYHEGGTEVRLCASSENFVQFVYITKNGSNDYTMTNETRPYVTDAEKTAWNAKQDTLIAGSGITISGNVISAEGGGGGMSEDDELLLATALVDLNDRKMDASEVMEKYQLKGDYVTSGQLDTKLAAYETALDEQNVEEVASYALNDLNARLLDVTSSLGGLKFVKCSQAEYDALTEKGPMTIYFIGNVVNNS